MVLLAVVLALASLQLVLLAVTWASLQCSGARGGMIVVLMGMGCRRSSKACAGFAPVVLAVAAHCGFSPVELAVVLAVASLQWSLWCVFLYGSSCFFLFVSFFNFKCFFLFGCFVPFSIRFKMFENPIDDFCSIRRLSAQIC